MVGTTGASGAVAAKTLNCYENELSPMSFNAVTLK